MTARIVWTLFGMPLLVMCFSGCRLAVPPASPEHAQATLREALEAWRKGETRDAFRGSSAITVVERKWQQGFRLLGYEVIGDGKMSGFDYQWRVRLSLQNANGKKLQEKAVYSVSTSPARVIVRGDS